MIMKESTKAGRNLNNRTLLDNVHRTDNHTRVNVYIRYIRLNTLILFLVIITGCAYFNTFYNANAYYDTGVSEIEAHYAAGRTGLPTGARDAFTTAIDKSLTVIDNYPRSKYIDDALLLIGKSYFYLGEHSYTEEYLIRLLQEYPNSPRTSEALVWLGKAHFSLGQYDTVEEDIAPVLAESNPSRELVTEIYRLRTDIALLRSDTVSAIQSLLAAVGLADAAQRAEFYFQLYNLARDQQDYNSALEFLDEYARLTPIEEDRINARLLRVQLLQEMNEFEIAFKEIRNMVALTEFVSIVPSLQLELGKIELSQGNIDAALEHFIDLFEEYQTLPEAEGAAFLAGEIYLTARNDIAAAKEYYEHVGNSSVYFQQAQLKLKQIADYDELELEIQALRGQLGGGLNDASGTTLSDVDETRISNELAYALFRIAEIQLHDFDMPDTALMIMAEIVSSFNETDISAQAAYVLYVNTQNNPEQAAFWRTLLIEQYPDTPYGLLLRGVGATSSRSELDSLVVLVDRNMPQNPRLALNLYHQIQMQFATEQSFFAIAYLYDEYLNELDSAISAYDEYLLQYPSGTYNQVANERLNYLRQIKASLSTPTIEANIEDVIGTPDSSTVPDPQLPASVPDRITDP